MDRIYLTLINWKDEKMSIEKHNEDLKQMLKEEIEAKRRILNRMIAKGVDKKDLLRFSQELDKLIDKYYKLDLDKK
ncbi:MAG: aspartyl-phosphate phosphatase Spo0E family protein [Tissierellia bacterium]|nr:aspartyl-phosphate phosphatase Spo0E family protein [Tissierellia bacterium]